MFRLSQRAWNNVVIFAMLFMVYLFTLGNDLINRETVTDEAVPLLPPYSIIMKLDFGYASIERIGQDWRVGEGTAVAVDDMVAKVAKWEQLTIQPTQQKPDSSPYIVSMQVAGEARARVFQLFPQGHTVLIQYQSDLYLVDNASEQQLIPER